MDYADSNDCVGYGDFAEASDFIEKFN